MNERTRVMSEQAERDVDVLVIGGGAAGSAAALQLGRARRCVVVVDAGEPRNAPAAHMQGYLGHDGAPPADFLARAHDEVRAYGTDIVGGRIVDVAEDANVLVCTTESGRTYRSRRLLLATGLRDTLPDIPGVPEHWGDRVIHCPWCHGWEVRDQRIAVIDTTGMGSHQALMFAQLSDQVTLIDSVETAVGSGLTDEQRERLRLGGVDVENGRATSISATGDRLAIDVEVTVDDGHGAESNDRRLEVDVAVVAPRFEPNVAVVEHLVDVADHFSGLGRHVIVDDTTGATSHPLIFAAGNVADPMQQVLHAAAHGSRVATMLHVALIEEDIELARRSAAEQREWDERYVERGDRMWSGNPNGSLVAELSGMVPGRALDVGCGEGADVIWLAEQGWQATGTDISSVAIERASAAADASGSTATFTVADAGVDAPSADSADLVTISYPAFRREAGDSIFGSILRAVAPGGRLLVIGHVLDDEALKHADEHGFDPDHYLSLDDMRELLPADCTVEVDEIRERPNAPVDSHHSSDRVLRIRRTA